MASDNKQTNTVTAIAAATAASAAAAKVDCTAILRAAKEYYVEVGAGALELKPYDVPKGELPGQVAAKIPKLGDIAGCKKR